MYAVKTRCARWRDVNKMGLELHVDGEKKMGNAHSVARARRGRAGGASVRGSSGVVHMPCADEGLSRARGRRAMAPSKATSSPRKTNPRCAAIAKRDGVHFTAALASTCGRHPQGARRGAAAWPQPHVTLGVPLRAARARALIGRGTHLAIKTFAREFCSCAGSAGGLGAPPAAHPRSHVRVSGAL